MPNSNILMYTTEDGLTKLKQHLKMIQSGYHLTRWQNCFKGINQLYRDILKRYLRKENWMLVRHSEDKKLYL